MWPHLEEAKKIDALRKRLHIVAGNYLLKKYVTKKRRI